MRGNKEPSKDGNRGYLESVNSENMENGKGVLRLGRFRLRLPSHRPTEADSSSDDLQSSTNSESWSMNMNGHYRHGRLQSVIVPKHDGEERLDNALPNSSSHDDALTLYRGPDSLSEALGDWLEASETLLRSDEMRIFLSATRHVACSVGDLAVRAALLPVTLPIHIVCSTTEVVLGGTIHIVTSAGAFIGSTLWTLATGQATPQRHVLLEQASTPSKQLDQDSDEAEKMHFLEKLRLDYAIQESLESGGHAKTMSLSDFLLRVGDLGLTTLDAKGQPVKVHYVDLCLDSSRSPCDQDDKAMVQLALQRLFVTGVSLLSKHPTVRLSKHYPSDQVIDWKAESSTAKTLREMAKMSTLERLQFLQESILIWSGKFRDERNKNALPAFLARGVVRKSPRDFMMLLWDNQRTAEYNNYCVSRRDALVLHDKILEGASEGAKVVQSETRVPYTSLTVKAKCLMHVRPLEAPDAGFVIVSRSLDAGEAGMHLEASGGVQSASKNEILWGINIFRAVPNHPHLTDLTSLSQVSSSLVPTFMANRIGLMGVEDFFKNVRANKA